MINQRARKVAAIAREAALDVLVAVDEKGEHSQRALYRCLEEHGVKDRRDRALTTELVYGVLRWRSWLDAALEVYAERGIADLDCTTLNALRMATYQIRRLDRVPERAAVFDAVTQIQNRSGEARSRFANAILRKLAENPPPTSEPPRSSVRSLSAQFGHPKWIVRSLRDSCDPADWIALCEAYSEPAPPVVRVRKRARDDVQRWLLENHDTEGTWGTEPDALLLPKGIDPLGTLPFERGWWIPQDEASQRVARLADIQEGQRVLDLCAGTGTKTTQLAELTGPSGSVLSVDLSPTKLAKLETLCTHWGLPSETLAADGTRPLDLPEAGFDRIVLDAPCSGLGTIRRRPEIKWRRSLDDVQSVAKIQSLLLTNAAPLLRCGGLLVYSVCTFIQEEGAVVIHSFLEEHAGSFEIEAPDEADSDGFVRSHPTQGGMDGFFIAVLKKTKKD